MPMTKKHKLILGSIIGCLCILVASCLRSCLLSDLNPKHGKVGAVLIPDNKITLTLWAGSRQESLIQPYEGVYRILEVSQPDMTTKYYDLPSTITDDRCRLDIYWYPSNTLVRLKDTAFAGFAQEFRSECLLDLNQNIMFTVIRGNGVTHIAQLSYPNNELTFPQSHNEERVAHSYVGKASSLSPTSSETVTIGTHKSQPSKATWTTNTGVLIGVIDDKR